MSSRPDCIFETHQLWQSGFSRVYSNSYSSCSFEPEIINIDQSSHEMYSNNIVNFLRPLFMQTLAYLALHLYSCISRSQVSTFKFFIEVRGTVKYCSLFYDLWNSVQKHGPTNKRSPNLKSGWKRKLFIINN